MSIKIGVVSQKGGVGKSALSQLIACAYASAGWNILIADLDISQSSSERWHRRRVENKVTPEINVEVFKAVNRALQVSEPYDLAVFDGAPHATAATKQIAEESNLTILPTGISLNDLEPTVMLAHELTKSGVPNARLAIALWRVGDSESENQEAAEYIKESGYFLLDGALPERTGYRRATDTGRTVAETPYSTLNQRADVVTQAIIDRLAALKKKRIA